GVGHAFVGGGDIGQRVQDQKMGYLGADFEPAPNGRAYRITKLLPGDGFELDQRSPLLLPGLNVKVGDYIVAIEGQPVRTDLSIQALLIGTAGRMISVSINNSPELTGARVVHIVPVASEYRMRYFDWVARKRAYVLTHGGPEIGYVHMPNMVEGGGMKEFDKHYYAQNLTCTGMIYDVRNNTGGYISALILNQIASRPYTWFKPRNGASWTREDFSFGGYSAALCNENSMSNAEEFADGFERLKIGPVIGVRTWGGEVGSGDGYPLIDGGEIYIPNYGAWTDSDKWIIEGRGVKPDIKVENDPASRLAGKDLQLDAAIAVIKKELARHPILPESAPPFPVATPLHFGTKR
ncbi:MAG TPA: S41 family peptidase, partial [Chthonomonadales bacterium]|nr:S41 family peptidase [Chthonomonadales bacterium]